LELLGEVSVPAMGSSVVSVVLSLVFFFAASLSLGKQVQSPADLMRLSAGEREMIASACGLDRQTNNPTQYYDDCIRGQLAALRASPGKPDLSHLATTARGMITSACELDRQINGPAQYYDCLRNQLARLGGTSPVTASGHAPASDARQRPARTPDGASGTAAPQKGVRLDPTILLAVTLLSSLLIVYGYKRFRSRTCSGCGSRTSNSSQTCDSCRARFRAAEIRGQEDKQRREMEMRARQQRCQEEKETQRQAEYALRREAEASAEQQRHREEETRESIRTLEDLQRMTGTDFERLIASLFIRDGYKVSQCKCSGYKDEDIDMVLEMEGSKDVVQYEQGKGNVGSTVIREFYKSMMRARARCGFVIATASFAHSAKEFVVGKPITLIDGHYLLAWISWADRGEVPAVPCSCDFNPYDVLGILPGASKDEIRSAYRGLVAKYHPDKVAHLGHEFQTIAREKALVINRAFEMLNHS
jgi:DnaJ-domain-containing protein 1